MADFRFVLVQGDPLLLAAMQLPVLSRLLARAMNAHLGDWVVVIDPTPITGTAVLFRPSVAPLNLTSPPVDINGVIADVNVLPMVPPPRAVHFIVMRTIADAGLVTFVGGAPDFFHVAAPIVRFVDRFAPPIPSVAPWLRPLDGRAMPVILLPADITGNAGPISIYPVDDGWNAPSPPERDSCRMRIEPTEVAIADMTGSWAAVHVGIRRSFERWARTISWRRVALVISGGGASVFRLVPLLNAFEAAGLPIDLIGGVSGSTALGACYAVGGLAKVTELAQDGGPFALATYGSLITSWAFERYLDNFLDGCGVCNTEIRVIPVTVTLAALSAPRPGVVIEGTFGQALRASGGAPFFGPYFVNNARRIDGAIMAGLPPPFLAEQFGADIAFAINVLPLPATRFPGEDVPILGDILKIAYRYTPLGRVADTWTSTQTMVHSIAEARAFDADFFQDSPPRDWGIIEPFLLWNSEDYMTAGLGPSVNVAAVAATCLSRWQDLP